MQEANLIGMMADSTDEGRAELIAALQAQLQGPRLCLEYLKALHEDLNANAS